MIAIAVAAAASVGCAASEVREQHYFAAYSPDGESNFFRVSVRASTRNSEAKFRAGLFPADAVDAVFGEISSETDPQKEIDTHRRTVSRTAARLGGVLESAESTPEQVKDASEKYNQAIENLRQRTQDAKVGQDRKFVFVYSTDPSRVVQAIQNFLQQQQLSKTLAHLFQASVVGEAMLAKESIDAAGRARTARNGVVAAASAALKEATVPDAAALRTSDDLRNFAARVRAVADALETAGRGMGR